MDTQIQNETKQLISLAERMGIPADDAIRQVSQLIAEEHPAESAGAGAATADTGTDTLSGIVR